MRLALSLACLGGAGLLHERFCEWRTIEVPAAEREAELARTLIPFRRVSHPAGNAAEWDRAEQRVRAYDRDWLACHRELRGEPEPGGPLAACLAARPYTVVGATAEAVSLAECERELYGALPERVAFDACLFARGHAAAPIPRWPFERLGARFTGPYFTETALFAEETVAGWRIHPLAAVAAGIVLPAALVAIGVWILFSRRAR